MQLSKRNAEQIIRSINDILPHKLNLMDLNGVIIASSDPERVGKFHGGAARILRENLDELRIFNDDEYEGTRKGTNFLLRVNDEPIGVLGITGNYDEILPFASVIKRMTELLVNEREHQRQQEFFQNRRMRFLTEWISHSEQVNKNFLQAGLELGVDLLIPRRILSVAFTPAEKIFDMTKAELTLETCLKKIDRQCLLCKSGNEFLLFSTLRNNDEIFDFAAKLKAEIEARCNVVVLIGVDSPAKDYLHMNEAYHHARKALQSCMQTRQASIRFYDDIDVELFVDEIPDRAKIRYIEKIFRHYKPADIPKAIQLLEKFFEVSGSVNKTAEFFGIHKNTVQQRIKRIAKLTGYDPRKLRDAPVLYMAMYLYRDIYL